MASRIRVDWLSGTKYSHGRDSRAASGIELRKTVGSRKGRNVNLLNKRRKNAGETRGARFVLIRRESRIRVIDDKVAKILEHLDHARDAERSRRRFRPES